MRTHDGVLIRLILWLMSVAPGVFIFFRLCQRPPFLMRAGGDVHSAFVSVHAAFVAVTGALGTRGEGRDADALRQKLDV